MAVRRLAPPDKQPKDFAFTAENADVNIARVRATRLRDFLESVELPAMIAILRIEQLYPFPGVSLAHALAPYSKADVIWFCDRNSVLARLRSGTLPIATSNFARAGGSASSSSARRVINPETRSMPSR